MTGSELVALLKDSTQAVALDNHFFYNGKKPLDPFQIPLDTVADLQKIPNKYKYIGMTVKVLSGGTVNISGDTIPDEYWLVGNGTNPNGWRWELKPQSITSGLALSADTNNSSVKLLYNGVQIGTAADLSEILSDWQMDNFIESGSVITEGDKTYIEFYYNEESALDPIRVDITGISGSGTTGQQGPQGEIGPQGPQGEKGADGAQGAQGAKGDQGEKGADGAQGPQGEQGAKGEDGAQGPKGDQGAKGEDGAQGPKGDQGADGAQGPQGEQGAKGEDGAQGPKGDQGEKGADGEQGPQGEQGAEGAQGPQGNEGAQGPQGEKGEDGKGVTILGSYDSLEELEEAHPTGNVGDAYLVNGELYVWDDDAQSWKNVGNIQGPQGPKGDQGEKGEDGADGAQGPQGEKGADGEQGPQGEKGADGEQGAQGPKGDQGEKGADGEQGPKGDQGEKGADGEQGPQGEKGIDGEQGPQGDQGAEGVQGPQGEQGAEGAQGPQGNEGVQGPQGEKGEDGKGVNILGSYDSLEELEAAHPTGNIGDAYLVNGELYVWDDDAQEWKNVGNIQGPQGEQGAEGAQGPQGEQGTDGEQGPQGDQGAEGARGPQGEKGADGEQGPQGEQGADGEQGPQGEKGADGEQGAKGEQGAQGNQGEQGPQGDQGAEGAQGEQGEQGPQGPQGSQGDQGAEGAQGPQGEQGADGEQGPQGDQGAEGAQGPQGEQGAEGAQGPQGEKGVDGEQGPQGDQGSDGTQGPQGPANELTIGSGLDLSGETLSVNDGYVKNIAMSALTEALIPEDAQEAFDTLEEIAAWIQSHPADAAEMNARIESLSGTVANLPLGDENVIEVVKVNGSALTVEDKAVNVDLTPYALDADLITVEDKLDELSGSVSSNIEAIIETFGDYATSADTVEAITAASQSSSTITNDIIVAGGPLADDCDTWPTDAGWTDASGNKVIPAGTGIEEILTKLFSKVTWPTINVSYGWNITAKNPTLTIKKGDGTNASAGKYEAGTQLFFCGATASLATNTYAVTTSGYSNGYKKGESGSMTSGTYSKTYTAQTSGDYNLAAAFNGFKLDSAGSVPYSITPVGANEPIPSESDAMYVNDGSNTVVINQTGLTYTPVATADFESFDLYAASNVKTFGDESKVNINDNSYSNKSTTATGRTQSPTFTGYRKYFYGCLDTPIAEGNINSSAIRSLTGSTDAASTTQWEFTAPSGTRQLIVAVAENAFTNIEIFQVGVNSRVEDVWSTKTVSVAGANGYKPINYKVWYFNAASTLPEDVYRITFKN